MSVEKIVTPQDAIGHIFNMLRYDFPTQYASSRLLSYNPEYIDECDTFLSQALITDDLSVLKPMSDGAWRVFFERAVQYIKIFFMAEMKGEKSIATVPYSATETDLKIFLIGSVLLQSKLPFPAGNLPINDNVQSLLEKR